ncbi:hypothetical protein [Nocardia cerradoensis]|uniref:PucR C-terminal helix-turn-helix domain-containing protein n=1 Tax=Nocardia cerradoensis TaxID=85688 RepID=A0A231HA19_9NOCA|nr:hypothetical protein [Nocardia cerradoensis]NKY42567.1 hypothetical protein [Nocardia cerradoensis]OXR45586.1 hypothetical protein B7C42_01878 [Nocardia cerradoensis]
MSERSRDVSEALDVVRFFDALIAGGAGLDVLLRGAAVRAGTVAGFERNGRISRFAPTGQSVPGNNQGLRKLERSFDGGSVWLERDDDATRDKDELIVERLAFAVGLLATRGTGSAGLALVVDPTRSIDERMPGLVRLHIDPSTRIRLIATERGTALSGISAAVPTRYGLLQATLDITGQVTPAGPAGLGEWVRADHAPESWEGAVIAHRLTTSSTPVVDATALGAMTILARAHDPDSPHRDVKALARLDDHSAEVLQALCDAPSLRSAAVELSMHHSTLQAKHESLTRLLGYDLRTTAGRMRYIAAEFLRRLGDY